MPLIALFLDHIYTFSILIVFLSLSLIAYLPSITLSYLNSKPFSFTMSISTMKPTETVVQRLLIDINPSVNIALLVQKLCNTLSQSAGFYSLYWGKMIEDPSKCEILCREFALGLSLPPSLCFTPLGTLACHSLQSPIFPSCSIYLFTSFPLPTSSSLRPSDILRAITD